MLQRLGIRGKILAVITVPIIVLLLAAGYITVQATNALGDATNAQQLVATADAARPFQSAFNAERDAAANFVDTYSTYTSARAGAQSSITTSLQALETTDQAALADVQEAFAGGQSTDSGSAMSVDAVRALGPTQPGEEDLTAEDAKAEDNGEWWAWPSADQTTLAADSLRAISDDIEDLAKHASGNTKTTLKSIAFQLDTEATATTNLFTIPETYQTVYIDSQADSDNTWTALQNKMNGVKSSDSNESVIAMISTVKDQMRDLAKTRESVRTIGASSAILSGWYISVLGSVNDMLNRSTIAVDDPTLSIQLTAYGTIYNLFQQLSQESTTNQRIIRQGEYKQGDATAARNQIAATDFALDQAQTATAALGGSVTVPDFGASTTSTSNFNFASIRNTISTGDSAQLATIATVDWVGMVDAEEAAQEPAYDQTIALAASRADELHQQALLQTAITVAAIIVAIALTIIVALLIARRIVVPLRRLTTTATAVRSELPRLVERVAMPGETVDVAEVQIPVESRDEVGRLAEAFNGVNAATLSIAAEQAALRGSISEMFVNVARRDQVLLNRQLASIDDMERTQDDPETLTKLFALDHLATRMRRNSESLLVLAGIDTGRRLRRSMPLSDVIRTASSEIELYERVQLELDADPAMLGHSALTAAHLFAELLENATVFSDPGTPVIVRTSERDGAYVVEIQDSGIGMTETELAEANSRVASTAASEILGAQRLGLFVVGRIARRIGARVSIASTEGAGTTATITMAPSLFDASFAPEVSHHTESTVDEAMHAPAALVSHAAENEQFDVPATGAAAAVAAYQPTVVESTPLVARAEEAAPSVDELIAADAAAAPEGVAVSGEDLTDGVSATGLPTRRRREASIEVSEEEQKKVIGLPARATAAQLSALEAATDAEEFKPAIPASEIAPQTPEERAQMFRGFRSRRELSDAAPEIDPEAESLGHAARRGGLAPEEIAAQNADAVKDEADVPEVMTIPELEADDEDFADESTGDGAGLAVGAGVVAATALSVPSFEDDAEDDVAYGQQVTLDPDAAMIVPTLEDDDEFVAASVDAVEAPAAVGDAAFGDAAVAGAAVSDAAVADAVPTDPFSVDSADAAALAAPVEQATAEPVAAPAAQFEAPATAPAPAAAPFSYADVYGSLPRTAPEPQPQQAWGGVESVALDPGASPEPTLDELIAGTNDEEAVKSGFFSRLFGRNKKAAAPEAQPAPAVEPVAAAPIPTFEPTQGFDPVAPASAVPDVVAAPVVAPPVVAAPVVDAAPAYEAPAAYDPAPAYGAPAYETPAYVAPVAYEAPAAFEPAPTYDGAPASADEASAEFAQASPNPGGAFALYGAQATEPRTEDSVGQPHTYEAPVAGQAFTPDELANPFGWEAAGANALAAAEPEVATEYQPVVDIQPEFGTEVAGRAELTSEVFSELSSLASVRPKVETTRAGLQRRRSVDAPAPEVKPIESEVQIAHKERDADEVRTRFSSFYSGTQRARHDVAEFEQRSQSTVGQE